LALSVYDFAWKKLESWRQDMSGVGTLSTVVRGDEEIVTACILFVLQKKNV
jgi:hypothetical protein